MHRSTGRFRAMGDGVSINKVNGEVNRSLLLATALIIGCGSIAGIAQTPARSGTSGPCQCPLDNLVQHLL